MTYHSPQLVLKKSKTKKKKKQVNTKKKKTTSNVCQNIINEACCHLAPTLVLYMELSIMWLKT
jgi:hypothetical protein